MKMIRTILVDDDQACLEQLSDLLKEYAEISIQAVISNPLQVSKEVSKNPVDLLFLDIEMPEISGLELAGKLKKSHPSITIVFVTAYSKYAIQAIKRAAYDYLLKPVDPDDLAETLSRYFSEQNSRIGLTDRLKANYPLTARELEIIDQICDGHTSEKIASQLHLSVFTVNTHRQNILRKTKCANFSELLGNGKLS